MTTVLSTPSSPTSLFRGISEKDLIPSSMGHDFLASIKQSIQDLERNKSARMINDSCTESIQFNEELFKCAKALYKLRHHPTIDLNSIDQLDNQLRQLNPYLPSVEHLVEYFNTQPLRGPLSLERTLEDIVQDILCNRYSQINLEDLERDCHIFACDLTEMQLRYVQRVIKASRTGFDVSFISKVERVWQETSTLSQKSFQRLIDGYKVLFIPSQREIFIIENENRQRRGAWKVVEFASSFFCLEEKKSRELYAIVRPHEAQASATRQEEYQREANFCMKLSGYPGIWPTHEIVEINGYPAMLQKAAGYTLASIEKGVITVVDLKEMYDLAKDNCLDVQQQKVYVDMIDHFLRGIQSLHNQGMIHRDIKPENVLCGSNGTAALTDMGGVCLESKKIDKYGNRIPNPLANMFYGTYYYACPEIIAINTSMSAWQKPKMITTQADIWSAGLVLWQLFSKQEPLSHPAFKETRKDKNSIIRRLIDLFLDSSKYRVDFHEPADKKSLLHLIGSCTRVDSAQRPTAATLVSSYQEWAIQAKKQLEEGKVNSIFEVFSEEWSNHHKPLSQNG